MAPVAPKTVTFMRAGVAARGVDVADGGGDDVAESLDGVADHLVRHAAEVDLAEDRSTPSSACRSRIFSATCVGPPTIRAPRRAARLAMVGATDEAERHR